MKKTGLLLLVFIFIVGVLCFAGCAGNNDADKDSSVTISGGGEEIIYTPQIIGGKDLHIKLGDDIDDYTQSVYAVEGTERFEVTVDAAGVNTDAAGKYTIKYKYKELTEEYGVTVYSAPAITADAENLELSYRDAFEGIYEGITAENCFGEELDVQLHDDGGMFNLDGSVNAGTFTLMFAAADRSGQFCTCERTVQISRGTDPVTDSDEYVYDVSDDYLEIMTDEATGSVFLSFSIDGIPIEKNNVLKENDVLKISGDAIYSICGISDGAQLRIMTSEGNKILSLDVTDDAPVSYDDSALAAFAEEYYACDEEIVFPSLELTNDRQNAVPVYTFDSQPVEGSFVIREEGTHILEAEIRGQKLTYEIQAYYYLGFTDGGFLTQDKLLNVDLPQNYELTEYTVTYADDSSGYYLYKYIKGDDAFGNLQEFSENVCALNPKYLYRLTVKAAGEGGDTRSQTVFCKVLGDSREMLSEEEHLTANFVYPITPQETTLHFTAKEVGGRRGAAQWICENPNGDHDKTRLRFSNEFTSAMKAGTYFSFDFYSTQALRVCMYVDGSALVFGETAEQPVYEVKFYDADGNRIDGTIQGGNFINQWITVEVKLLKDCSGTSYNGLFIYGGPRLYNSSTYFANMRISEKSVMEDESVNPPLKDYVAGETTVPDIWTGKDELY